MDTWIMVSHCWNTFKKLTRSIMRLTSSRLKVSIGDRCVEDSIVLDNSCALDSNTYDVVTIVQYR